MKYQPETTNELLKLFQQFKKVESLAWEDENNDPSLLYILEGARNTLCEATKEAEINFENPIFSPPKYHSKY